MNATLAEWLGLDLTKFVPGSMTIGDVVAGEGLALIQSVQAEPGLKKTVTLDLDLRKSNGQSLPVQIIHSVTSMRDGAPGESRTIVLAREKSDAAWPVRFGRCHALHPLLQQHTDGNRLG